MLAVFYLLLSYLVGTFPTAVTVGRFTGHDPTAEGSGNPGASNVLRTSGRKAGAITLAVDVTKAAVPTGVGLIWSSPGWALAGGLAACLGHIFPATRRFRGGKGVATGAGVALVMYPLVTLAMVVIFIATVKVVRRAAVGSMLISVLLPIGCLVIGRPLREVLGVAAISAVILLRHRSNVVALRAELRDRSSQPMS